LDYLNNRDRKSLLISSLSLASIAFIHVETYFIAVSTTLVFALISLIFTFSKRTAVLYPSLKIILPSIAALFPFALLSITTYHYFGVFSNYLGPANQRYGLTFFSGILGAQSAAADPYWGNIPMMLLLMQGRGVVVPFVNFLALILVLLGTTLTGLEANGRKLLFSMNCTMIICILNLYGVVDILPARLALFYPAPILIGLSLDWLTARAGSSLDWMSRETVSSYRKAVTIGEYSVDWLGAKIRLGLDWVSAKVASGGGRIERAQIGVLGRSIDFRAVAYSMDWIETRIGLVLNWLNERIVSGYRSARTRVLINIRENNLALRIGTHSKKNLKVILFASILFYSAVVAVSIRITLDAGVYAPSANVLDETNRLKEMFGYGNESIILLVEPEKNYGRLTEWAEAITGDKVYLGHLTYLLSNQTLEDAYSSFVQPIYYSQGLIGSWNRLRINGALGHLQNYTIVVSEKLYTPDPNELKMLMKISDGIYILNPKYAKST
jgi:hypothetical protein